MKHTLKATAFFALLFFYFNVIGQDGVGINTLMPRGALHVAGEHKDTALYSIGRLYGVVGVDTSKAPYTAGVYGRGYANGVFGAGELSRGSWHTNHLLVMVIFHSVIHPRW